MTLRQVIKWSIFVVFISCAVGLLAGKLAAMWITEVVFGGVLK